MRLCLNCLALSRPGALYCVCGRSFEGTGQRCRSGHLSPPGSRACVVCSRPPVGFVQGARYLPLAWLPRLLALGTALLLWRLCLAWPGPVLGLLGRLAGLFLGVLFGASPQSLSRGIAMLVPLGIALWLLCRLAGALGIAWPGALLRGALALLGRGVRTAVLYLHLRSASRGLRDLVVGDGSETRNRIRRSNGRR